MEIFDKDPAVLTKSGFGQAFKLSFSSYTTPKIFLTKNQARDIRRWAGPQYDNLELAGVNRLLVESFCEFLAEDWEKSLDIRQVLTDNAMKDMQEEEDKKLFTVLENLCPKP